MYPQPHRHMAVYCLNLGLDFTTDKLSFVMQTTTNLNQLQPFDPTRAFIPLQSGSNGPHPHGAGP